MHLYQVFARGARVQFELKLTLTCAFHLFILKLASDNNKQAPSPPSKCLTIPQSEKLLQASLKNTMCCDDLSSCLCGAMCCYCCLGSAAESDNRRRRECRNGRSHGPVYVQPVVVSTTPMNGKARRGGHQPDGYYYVQSNEVLYHPTQYGHQQPKRR